MKIKFHLFSLLLLSAVIFSSCGEDDSNPIAAKVSLINASPSDDATSVDFLTDGDQENMSGVTYPGNTQYFNVSPLGHTVTINQAGTSNTLATREISPAADDFHTVILFGSDSISTFYSVDDVSQPPAGQAKVRFFHLVENGPTVDIGTQDSSGNFTPIFENRNFETSASMASSQNFTPIDSGLYTIEVRTEELLDVPVITIDSVHIQEGKIYTLYARGQVDLSLDVGLEVIEYEE